MITKKEYDILQKKFLAGNSTQDERRDLMEVFVYMENMLKRFDPDWFDKLEQFNGREKWAKKKE